MILSRKGWVSILFLSGVLGCQKSEPPQAPKAAPPTQTLKEFRMQDLRGGLKSMELMAVEGRLFEDQQMAELELPAITFFKEGKESSLMRAPKGKVHMVTHAVEAWGGVFLVTADSTTLRTERLNYDPKTRLITSNDPVHLEKPDSVTDGEGLETDPELKNVKIKHQKVRLKSGKTP